MWDLQFELLRRLTPQQRLEMGREMTLAWQRNVFAMLRARHPELSDDEIWLKLAVRRLGRDVVRNITGGHRSPMTEADPFAFAVKIGALLDEMGIPYLVGGSVASMMYGEPRYTRDLDLVIDTDERGARTLAEHLQDEFYIDVEGAAEAVRERSVFSAIHIETFLRVDFFTIGDFPVARREQLARGRVIAVSNGVARFCRIARQHRSRRGLPRPRRGRLRRPRPPRARPAGRRQLTAV